MSIAEVLVVNARSHRQLCLTTSIVSKYSVDCQKHVFFLLFYASATHINVRISFWDYFIIWHVLLFILKYKSNLDCVSHTLKQAQKAYVQKVCTTYDLVKNTRTALIGYMNQSTIKILNFDQLSFSPGWACLWGYTTVIIYALWAF